MNDDAFYDDVGKEMQENRMIPGVWTLALAEADGDENRAKAIYIKLRDAQLSENSRRQLEEAKRMTMPAFGDPKAVSWEVVNERWIRNTYENGDVTMSDKDTGRMWLYNANPCETAKKWHDAVTYCDNLTYAGYSDWRLPDKDIIEAQFSQKSYFSGVQSYYYWSGTSYAYVTVYAWAVSMDNGHVNTSSKTDYSYVWPVRSEQ